MILLKKTWLLTAAFLINIPVSYAQDRPLFTKRECNTGVTVHYLDEDGQPKVPYSSFCCSDGSKIQYSITDENDIISSHNIPTRSGDNNSWYVPVEITFKPGKSGTVTIVIDYARKLAQNTFCHCEWTTWKPLLEYRIYVGPLNPGGNLVNNQYIASNDDYIVPGPPNGLELELEYLPDDLNKFGSVMFGVVTPLDSVYHGEPRKELEYPFLFYSYYLEHNASQYGDYIFKTNLTDNCSNEFTGPYQTVSYVPNCYFDTDNSVNVSGPGLSHAGGGYKITTSETYTASFPGVTALATYYNLSQDGGDDLLVNENADGSFSFQVNNPLGSYRIEAVKDTTWLGDYCLTLPPLKIFSGGSDTTFQNTCAIELPRDLEVKFGYRPEDDPDSLVLRHFSATIKSAKKVVVKPGMILEAGAELVLDYMPPGLDPNDPDKDMNFTQLTAYNDYGETLSESRSYFGDNGQPLQAQSKNLSEGVILASETLYDAYGRPAIQTLAAPVSASSFPVADGDCPQPAPANLAFAYSEDFVDYGAGNFDLDKRLTPDPMPGDLVGTLGWYYSHNNGAATNARFNEPLNATTSYPYIRTLYKDDGSGVVEGTTLPGDVFAAGQGRTALQEKQAVSGDDPYLADYLAILELELNLPAPDQTSGAFMKQTVTDEDGRKSVTYTDKDGQAILSLYYGKQSIPLLKSYEYYNLKGQVLCSVTPNGVQQYENNVPFDSIDKTTYEYNWKGYLTALNEIDAGRTEYLYARDGRIRFSQNAEQRTRGAYSYTNYDRANRPVESGEYLPGGDDAAFGGAECLALLDKRGDEAALPGGMKRSVVRTAYDLAEVNIPRGHTQRFMMGAVSYTRNDNVTTWYSYDERGRVEWMLQDIAGLGAKLVEYQYGPDGNVKEVAYQRDSADAFYHYYEYDDDARLVKAYSGRTAPKYNAQGEITNLASLTLQATYDYYVHGPLKRMELPKAKQGMDYIYTVDGRLKAINHADLTKDPGGDGGSNEMRQDVFGMTLDYHPDDYTGAGYDAGTNTATGYEDQYAGNIKAQSWHSPVDGHESKTYAYKYDQRQQLTDADFGDMSGDNGNYTFQADISDKYKEEIPEYDNNGNILELNRTGDLGQSIAAFEYIYEPNTNRLDAILQGGDTLLDYTYNAIGQLISQEDTVKAFHIDYDVTGKVTGVYADEAMTSQPIMEIDYDDRGFRVAKTSYDTTFSPMWKTWYVRDGAGSVLSIYAENLKTGSGPIQYEIPVYGANRIGMYRPLEQTTYYEVKDHLGNVRAVIGSTDSVRYTATMETELAAQEEEYFEITRRISTADYINHTPDTLSIGSANEVVRINNARDSVLNTVGAGIMLKVYPGDTIRSKAFAKYADFDNGNTNLVPGLAGYLSSVFGLPVVGESSLPIFDVVEQPWFLALNAWNNVDDTQPRAYLNFLLFDNNFSFQDFGFDQVSTAANITGDSLTQQHEELNLEVVVKREGFIYLYVTNENDQDMEVYFDDFIIDHIYGDIVAGGDYYPFGLPLAGRTIQKKGYRYDYQGEFAEKDKETGWNAFEARMYEPVIGRWMSVDPSRQFWSGYLGMGNNPVNGIDPNGEFWEEFWNWITKGHWVSDAGIEFIENNPEASYNGWSENRLTGYASIGYLTEDGLPGVASFEAVQDYTFGNWDIYLDFDFRVTAGLRASALARGLKGFDVNIGSVTLARWNFIENRWMNLWDGHFEYSTGYSAAYNGVGGEFSVIADIDFNDKEKSSVKAQLGVGAYGVNLQGAIDLAQGKLEAQLGSGGSFALGVGVEVTGGLVVKQHNSFHK